MRSRHEGKRYSHGRGDRYVPPERGQLPLPGLNDRMVQSAMVDGRRLLELLPNLRLSELSSSDLLKAVVAFGSLVAGGAMKGPEIAGDILIAIGERVLESIVKGKIKK